MIKACALLLMIGPLSAGLCRYHIEKTEKSLKIPPHLLGAIGQVESGKYSAVHKRKEAWPWTVYSQGRGQFFQTKTQAEQHIKTLLAAGETNIDIGCMQINWRHHHTKFQSVSEMLHPRHNVAYAGKLLVQHYEACKDWEKACGNYHSKTPSHHHKYRTRIQLAQNDLKSQKKTPPQKAPRFRRWGAAPTPRELKFFALQQQQQRKSRWLR